MTEDPARPTDARGRHRLEPVREHRRLQGERERPLKTRHRRGTTHLRYSSLRAREREREKREKTIRGPFPALARASYRQFICTHHTFACVRSRIHSISCAHPKREPLSLFSLTNESFPAFLREELRSRFALSFPNKTPPRRVILGGPLEHGTGHLVGHGRVQSPRGRRERAGGQACAQFKISSSSHHLHTRISKMTRSSAPCFTRYESATAPLNTWSPVWGLN